MKNWAELISRPIPIEAKNMRSISGRIYLTSTFFYEGTSVAWYYNRDYNILTEEISPYNDMDVSCGFKVPFKDAEFDFQVSGYNIFDHSGFKYYYLKKRYFQFSVAMRY